MSSHEPVSAGLPPTLLRPPASTTRLAVRVENLRHVYSARVGDVVALDGISFAVQRREFVSIIGPSGCGKSTLLRLIGGLLTPTAGTVDLEGQPPAEALRRKAVGFVFQEPALLPWRTVLQNIALR
jgi:NitT/TauT family transport system ATP-binding protein